MAVGVALVSGSQDMTIKVVARCRASITWQCVPVCAASDNHGGDALPGVGAAARSREGSRAIVRLASRRTLRAVATARSRAVRTDYDVDVRGVSEPRKTNQHGQSGQSEGVHGCGGVLRADAMPCPASRGVVQVWDTASWTNTETVASSVRFCSSSVACGGLVMLGSSDGTYAVRTGFSGMV